MSAFSGSRARVPALASAAWSAFRSGGLVAVAFRPSARSFSGWVLVAAFRPGAGAPAFARRWAGRLGVPVFVRRRGALLLVSVPVLVPAAVAAPASFRVAGGLRGFAAAAAAWRPLPAPSLAFAGSLPLAPVALAGWSA